MSLLEERIKRSSRKTIIPKPDMEITIIKASVSPQKENTPPNRNNTSNHPVRNQDDHDENNDIEEEEEDSLPPVM